MADAEEGGECLAGETSLTTNLTADSNKTDDSEAQNVEPSLKRTPSQASKLKIVPVLFEALVTAKIGETNERGALIWRLNCLKSNVDLLLKATADAPIMKQKKWSVEADRKVSSIIQFIKKYLKLESHDSLFLYVNQSFAPSPDQILRNLYDCFGTDGKLILHYCKTQAWG